MACGPWGLRMGEYCRWMVGGGVGSKDTGSNISTPCRPEGMVDEFKGNLTRDIRLEVFSWSSFFRALLEILRNFAEIFESKG